MAQNYKDRQKVQNERVAKGICKTCNAERINFERSKIRGDKCLDRVQINRKSKATREKVIKKEIRKSKNNWSIIESRLFQAWS